jgi:hypothetical protein
MLAMGKLISPAVFFVLLPTLCFAWGREGHEIIGKIAEDHLNAQANITVRSLLGNDHLDSIANWADDIRRERRETAPWHYVNIPFGYAYKADRDCPAQTSCVVAQIARFLGVLSDSKADREQRAEALKFLVHFAGDIHQPMDAAKEGKGGNDIHVLFLGADHCGRYECNLHGVWDTSLIEHAGLEMGEYAARLEALIKADNLEPQAGGTPEDWANESLQLAQAAWVHDGANLDETYYRQQTKVVDRQMALAGLRLAKLLNAALQDSAVLIWEPPSPQSPDDMPRATVHRELVAGLRVGKKQVTLEKIALKEVQASLGGAIGHRGDAGESLQWLCLTGTDAQGRWALWLESDEVGGGFVDGFALQRLGRNETMDQRCQSLPASQGGIALPALRLGMTEIQVRRLLGQPTLKYRDTLIYAYETETMIRNVPYAISNTVYVALRGGVVWAIQVWRNTVS